MFYLYKIINKNTIKLSYSCMNNIYEIITSHNKTVLSNKKSEAEQTRPCNCRNKTSCPRDFLDITLDLRTAIYKPYKKPNSNLTYIHKQSNHPPSIIKNLPKSINKRLSDLLDLFAFRVLVVRSGRLRNLHNLLGE